MALALSFVTTAPPPRPARTPAQVYRQSLWLLTSRDLKVRYATSFLGYLWSVLDPGSELPEHVGPNAGVLRYHLGVRCGQDAALAVERSPAKPSACSLR